MAAIGSRAASFWSAVRSASKGTPLESPRIAFGVAYARARYRISPLYYSLYRFNRIPFHQWSDYLTDYRIRPPLERISKGFHILARNKALFADHCIEQGLPTVPIICVFGEGTVPFHGQFRFVPDVDRWEKVLAEAPSMLFAKPVDGAHGEGALAARRNGENWDFANQTGSAADLYRYCMDKPGKGNGWILQPTIEPHPSLADIMPGKSLGTIRALTYLDAHGPHLLLPVLRIPGAGSITDNFSGGRAGNLVAQIDLETGKLGTARYSVSRDWPRIVDLDAHPDTGGRISGRVIPGWSEVRALLLRAQALTPQLRTIGWDVAVTTEGPVLVEANTRYAIDLLQVAYDRGIRRDLVPVLSLAENKPVVV